VKTSIQVENKEMLKVKEYEINAKRSVSEAMLLTFEKSTNQFLPVHFRYVSLGIKSDLKEKLLIKPRYTSVSFFKFLWTHYQIIKTAFSSNPVTLTLEIDSEKPKRISATHLEILPHQFQYSKSEYCQRNPFFDIRIFQNLSLYTKIEILSEIENPSDLIPTHFIRAERLTINADKAYNFLIDGHLAQTNKVQFFFQKDGDNRVSKINN
jgi:hypothetical protein